MIIRSVLDDLKNLGLLEPEKDENIEEPHNVAEQKNIQDTTEQPLSNFCPLGNRDCVNVDRYDDMNHIFCCDEHGNAQNINSLKRCPLMGKVLNFKKRR